MTYVELQVMTHFSFLRGVSSPAELFARARDLGMTALGVADYNSVAGLVRAHVAAKETGVQLVAGCCLVLNDGSQILVYPTDRAAYGRLCRLLTIGASRAGKGKCDLAWADVEDFSVGLIAILLPDMADDRTSLQLKKLKSTFGRDAHMALTLRRRPNDKMRLHELSNLAAMHGVPTVVTNDVLFDTYDKAMLQDVVTCIRHTVTIDELGDRREQHADRYLKPAEEMARLFPDYLPALRRTADIADRCRFTLDDLKYQYPEEELLEGRTAMEALKQFTWEGAKERYPEGVPDKVIASLRHEFDLIEKLDYAPYFLTVFSIVRFAKGQKILCQGRGSAANSTVCFCLGITSIDPDRNDLLFERFISEARNEPPDIDVDFEHQRREEVIQWVYEHYGRDHAALVAVITRYRAKAAIQDVGKALGLPQDVTMTLSGLVRGYQEEIDVDMLEGTNLNLQDRRLRLTLELARALQNAPRHLSQHPGGFVLTRDRLDELVPIEPASMEGRATIVWDKDDIAELKFMKVDCLALGMLTCIEKCLTFLREHKGADYTLASIPAEDPRTYAMIRRADTVGVFQIESRAQMSMLPQLRPRTFYDIVVQVAIVRPGPIQGGMVHPYIRRRQGKEIPTYPNAELESVLGKTLGVPLFQEQCMRLAIVAAGLSATDADGLRREMATFKHTGGISKYKQKLLQGMLDNGYDEAYANQLYEQLQGFGSYGFPESHAASFALLAYASSWLKCHHPDVFLAAILNAQPMGFYQPAQLIRDAQEHQVEVRPVCINASRWDCTLEPTSTPDRLAVRLGFRHVRGLSNVHVAQLTAARGERPFRSVEDVWRRSGVPVAALSHLADADAFLPSLKVSRRDAIFQIQGLRNEPLPLFAGTDAEGGWLPEAIEPATTLRKMTDGAEVVEDYAYTGLSLRGHPLSFLRYEFAKSGYKTCADVKAAKDKTYVQVAGLVLVRQRPGTANGVTFLTIEDETANANVIVWEKTYEQNRAVVRGSRMMLISGYVQREGDVVNLIARSVADLSNMLGEISCRNVEAPAVYLASPEARGLMFKARYFQ